jgi:hypothetical protein
MLFSNCKKNNVTKKYSVKGRLFECSSNPIPVKNYELSAFQLSTDALFGGVAGLRKTCRTDVYGNFELTYTTGNGTDFFSSNINHNPISITGTDSLQFKGLYSDWYPIKANKDTNLNEIFLYKKIETLVRKIKFINSLSSNDSMELITHSAYRSKYKWIYGPVSAGTLLIADTIRDQLSERYNIDIKGYYFTSVLKKPFYQTNFDLVLNPGDEAYREIILTYQ